MKTTALMAGIGRPLAAMVGLACLLVASQVSADGWRHHGNDRGYDNRHFRHQQHGYHNNYGPSYGGYARSYGYPAQVIINRGYYAPPPVVVYQPYYPPPPVVYAPAYQQPGYVVQSYGAPAYGGGYARSPNFGTAVGGALGGYLGSQVGHGSGRLAATAAGAVFGAILGGQGGYR